MAGKKLQITLPTDVCERLEEMSKTASQKKSAVIIAAINLMYTAKQQKPMTKIEEGQAVIM
jgi:predicted transcriptional regulator